MDIIVDNLLPGDDDISKKISQSSRTFAAQICATSWLLLLLTVIY